MSKAPQTSMVRGQQFARLWVRAQLIVASFISGSIHDRADAEDVLQTVAASAFEAFDQYDPSQSFTAWALGIARFRVLNYYRAQRRDRHLFGEQAMRRIVEEHVQMEDLVDPYREALERCLDTLGERQRRMLDDRYRDNLKTQQIGLRWRMSANAVTVALHRARQALATCIERRIEQEDRRG